MAESPPSRRPVSLRAVLGRAAYTLYDSLWRSAGWSVCFWLGPYSVLAVVVSKERLLGWAAGLLLLAGVAVATLGLAALLAHARIVVTRGEGGLASTLAAALRGWARAALWLLTNVLVVSVGVVDLAFYLQARAFWIAVLGAVWLYLFLFWICIQMFVGPALAGGVGLRRALRNAALLALENLGFSLGLAALLGGLAFALALPVAAGINWLSAASAALALFLLPAGVAVVVTEGYEALVSSYRPEADDEAGVAPGASL